MKPVALIGVIAVLIVGGVSAFGYLTWAELGQERQARLAAEALAQSEASARIDAVNAAAHEKIARVAAENTAAEEKVAKDAAESEAQRQTQARLHAEEVAREESTKQADAERARTAAEEDATRQQQARLQAEEVARAEVTKTAREASARKNAELEADRERSERARMKQALASQEIRAEKDRVLELAKTHPTIKAVVSGELTFYFEPLPRYTAANVSRAVEEIAIVFSSWSPYGAKVRRVYNVGQADISVAWVRDYGTHILGEAIYVAHIKVGLGTTNCLEEWMAFDASTVKKILWHELGHSMGYGHSDDPNNVMYKYTSTRFEIDQEISEVIAGGWYYPFPLCDSGTYYYSFETKEPNAGFDIAVLPPNVDPKDFSQGRGRSYSGCGTGSWRRYSGSCTVAKGAVIYISNTSFTKAIRLTGQIADANYPPWPDMTWDEEVFDHDDATLTRYWDLFHN